MQNGKLKSGQPGTVMAGALLDYQSDDGSRMDIFRLDVDMHVNSIYRISRAKASVYIDAETAFFVRWKFIQQD